MAISYQTVSPMSSMQLFSSEPIVRHASMDGDDVLLAADTLIPYDAGHGISIVIPHGFALETGQEVNPWMHEEEAYADVEHIIIVQGTDTSRISGSLLHSFVRDLGGSSKGLVLK